MRTRRDLSRSDYGLVLRMVVVGLATPLAVFAALAGVMLTLDSVPVRVVVVVALCVGAWSAVGERVAQSSRGRRLAPADAPELHAILERLCVVADLPKPALVLERRAMPNSWIEGTTRGIATSPSETFIRADASAAGLPVIATAPASAANSR